MKIKSGTFADMAKEIKEKNKRIIMFGAGVIGSVTAPEIVHTYKLDSYVKGYIDNDSKKWGTYVETINGKKRIYPPEYLNEFEDTAVILLNISRYAEVLNQLESMVCTKNVSCYMIPMMCIINFRQKGNQGVSRECSTPVIPKKIHYMWLGGKEIPDNLKKCIDSWRKYCPEYEIIRWDENNYDIEKNLYMKQAYETGNYGFVPDYARLDILYTHGGIYMDTDVEVIKPLDSLLYQNAFCSVEKWQVINFGGCSGAVKEHESLKTFRSMRENLKFIEADGSLNRNTCGFYDTKTVLQKGYQLTGKNQKVMGMNIYTSDYFHPYDYMSGMTEKTNDTFAIHHFNGGWLDDSMIAANEKTSQAFKELYRQTQRNS